MATPALVTVLLIAVRSPVLSVLLLPSSSAWVPVTDLWTRRTPIHKPLVVYKQSSNTPRLCAGPLCPCWPPCGPPRWYPPPCGPAPPPYVFNASFLAFFCRITSSWLDSYLGILWKITKNNLQLPAKR